VRQTASGAPQLKGGTGSGVVGRHGDGTELQAKAGLLLDDANSSTAAGTPFVGLRRGGAGGGRGSGGASGSASGFAFAERVPANVASYLFVMEHEHSCSIEEQLLSCSQAELTAISPSAPPMEISNAIGRNGEACAAMWLRSQATSATMPSCFGQAATGCIWEVHWENEEQERGRPWDMRCVSGERTVYVEVKATSRHDTRAVGEFEISGLELLKAKDCRTNYVIMRMCGVPVNQRSGALSVCFFVDPWSMLSQTEATLQMRIPTRVRAASPLEVQPKPSP
jgi:hypothetical protein